jgi:uncharacterized repeat protein (TIGR01451 family)
MKSLNLLKKITNSSKKVKMLVLGLATVTVMSGAAFAGWTPDRPVFDWNNPNDRQGSLNGPRINSFVNTPYYGDERAFFDVRKQENTNTDAYDDVLHNVSQGSHKLVMRTYIHNGANQSKNASGESIAKNTKVRIDLPQGASTALRARSYVSISNPAQGYPAEVTDTTEMVDSGAFSIGYVPGSAKVYNAAHPGGAQLSDAVVGAGAQIGYDQMNGNLPGCFEFQTFVEITVEVKTSDSQIEKVVKSASAPSYGEMTTVKPGEKVQWRLKYANIGQTPQENVRLYDSLPAHLKVDPGSVRWIYKGDNGVDQDVKMSDTDLFAKQVDFGTWNKNTFFYLRFDTTALGDFEGCEVDLTNQLRANSKQEPTEKRDNASVKIVKENCNPTNPVFSCDLLKAEKVEGTRTVNYTVNASAAGGATINNYVFDFGDKEAAFTTDKNTASHTYAPEKGNGPFATRVKVNVAVGNETKVAEGDQCAAAISFTPPNTPPETPGTPGTPSTPGSLPETGAGSTIAIFLAVTAAATAAYYAVVRRATQL